MKLFIINHTYRFAAEEAMISLLGAAPTETVECGDYPENADDALVTRIEGIAEGRAYATLSVGGKGYVSVINFDSDDLDLPENFELPADRSEASTAPTAVRELVRRRQHALKLAIAHAISAYKPLGSWGALTGMRPTKLARRLIRQSSGFAAMTELTDRYLLSPDRASMTVRAASAGLAAEEALGEDGYLLYLGVPFCPSRCKYCSFVSESVGASGSLVEPYVEKLLEEIRLRGEIMRSSGLVPRAVYIGGGTPTTLNPEQLRRVCAALFDAFRPPEGVEFTVEAGRPDTIDREKLLALQSSAVTRISINPQSLNPDALRLAGRPHSPEQFFDAFALAQEVGFDTINTDLIAGLDGDTPDTFADTLKRILELKPENLTIHTLARKRGSTLNRVATESAETVTNPAAVEMVDAAYPRLMREGYSPYYLYRQKYMVAPLENTGWSLPGHDCVYNSLIMDEVGFCLALGAGGMSKLVSGELVERVSNPKFAAEYIACDFTKSGETLSNWIHQNY